MNKQQHRKALGAERTPSGMRDTPFTGPDGAEDYNRE
jgi:hypothetical protein